MKPNKITVEASPDLQGVLDIKDAMQQVIDYFALLTARGQTYIVRNLVFASTNSPSLPKVRQLTFARMPLPMARSGTTLRRSSADLPAFRKANRWTTISRKKNVTSQNRS